MPCLVHNKCLRNAVKAMVADIIKKQILQMTQTCHLRTLRAVNFCSSRVYIEVDSLEQRLSSSVIPVTGDHFQWRYIFRQ